MKESVYDSSLPYIIVDKKDLKGKYPLIGYGQEADVYRYNDEFAIKIFSHYSQKKFDKIEAIERLYDDAYLFPMGLVGFSSGYKEGYFMQLVESVNEMKDFDDLKLIPSTIEKIRYLKLASRALKRAHNSGIIIGDIKADNILIGKDGQAYFGDTDNYKYGNEYDYDLKPMRSNWLKELYSVNFSEVDNDNFLMGMLALEVFLGVFDISLNKDEIRKSLEKIESKTLKDGLKLIVSDAHNKPNLSEILDSVDPDLVVIKQLKL